LASELCASCCGTPPKQRPEADADLAALDPRCLSLVRWADERVGSDDDATTNLGLAKSLPVERLRQHPRAWNVRPPGALCGAHSVGANRAVHSTHYSSRHRRHRGDSARQSGTRTISGASASVGSEPTRTTSRSSTITRKARHAAQETCSRPSW